MNLYIAAFLHNALARVILGPTHCGPLKFVFFNLYWLPVDWLLQPLQSGILSLMMSAQLLPLHPSDVTLSLISSTPPSWIRRCTVAPLIHTYDHVRVTVDALSG